MASDDAKTQGDRARRGHCRASGRIAEALSGSEASVWERTLAVQHHASAVGFDWPDPQPVFMKVMEETEEVREAWHQRDTVRVAEEVGDLFFAALNLARHLKVNPEDALQGATQRFCLRLRWVEDALMRAGKSMANANVAELEELWEQAKKALQEKER